MQIKFKNNYNCYVHHRCHKNNQSVEQNISESKPYDIKILSIPNFTFFLRYALNKIAERRFNVYKSSSFINHNFLLKFLFKGATKSLFYHRHKKKFT